MTRFGSVLVERASVNVAAGATDSAVVAASPGKRIRVLSAFLLAGANATNSTFNSKGSGAGTAISPLLANAANGGAVLPHNPLGWFETGLGEGLTLTTGSGSTTGVQVVYIAI